MSKGAVKSARKEKDQSLYQDCITCDKNLSKELKFYNTTSDLYKNGKYPVCRDCLVKKLPKEDFNDPVYLESFKNLLCEINRPFIFDVWLVSIDEAKKRNRTLFGTFMKNLAMNHNKNLTWRDSTPDNIVASRLIESNSGQTQSPNNTNDVILSTVNFLEDKNREDVIRMVGYDPFLLENDSDKVGLYNKLVDFLDESTLEDSFKLPTVIEIVKSFNQLDKINHAIATITGDAKNLADNVGRITSLVATKEKILKTVLSLAKDNGISVNHNNNKSKGGGTLSGVMKQLQEKGFTEADVNLFDIQTSEGMRQVADLSNENIRKQLMFDENDYTNMIIEQRDLIQELTDKLEISEENNRKLRLLLKQGSEITI